MDHDLSGNGLGDMGSPLAKFAAIAGWQNFAAALAGSASHWNPAATAAAVAALGARQHLSNGIQQRHSPLTGVILNGASPDSSSHALKIESSPSSHTSANAAINSSMEEGSEFTQLENPQDLEDLLQYLIHFINQIHEKLLKFLKERRNSRAGRDSPVHCPVQFASADHRNDDKNLSAVCVQVSKGRRKRNLITDQTCDVRLVPELSKQSAKTRYFWFVKFAECNCKRIFMIGNSLFKNS